MYVGAPKHDIFPQKATVSCPRHSPTVITCVTSRVRDSMGQYRHSFIQQEHTRLIYVKACLKRVLCIRKEGMNFCGDSHVSCKINFFRLN